LERAPILYSPKECVEEQFSEVRSLLADYESYEKDSSQIQRHFVIMHACTRIRVRCEKGKPVVRRGRKA